MMARRGDVGSNLRKAQKGRGVFCCCGHIINSYTLYSQQLRKQAMPDTSLDRTLSSCFSFGSLLRGILQSTLPDCFLLGFLKLSRAGGVGDEKGKETEERQQMIRSATSEPAARHDGIEGEGEGGMWWG